MTGIFWSLTPSPLTLWRRPRICLLYPVRFLRYLAHFADCLSVHYGFAEQKYHFALDLPARFEPCFEHYLRAAPKSARRVGMADNKEQPERR